MSEKPERARDAPAAVASRMDHCRKQIDALDEKLVELLNARAAHALEIGRLKDSVGLETYQPQREIAVLEQARSANRGPLDAGAITRLFERIIDENRRLERLAKQKATAGGSLESGDEPGDGTA